MDDSQPRRPLLPRRPVLHGVLLLTALAAAERVTFKAMADEMAGYGYALAMILTLLHALSAFALFAHARWYTGRVGAELTDVPLGKTAVMALLETARVFMTVIVAEHVPGALTVLLLQAQQPLTMLASACLRGQAYDRRHFAGAAAVLAGAVLAAWPQLRALPQDSPEAWASLVYLLSALPAAAGALFREKALRQTPVDLHCFLAWQTALSFVWGLVFSALGNRLQGVGGAWGDYPSRTLGASISGGLSHWAASGGLALVLVLGNWLLAAGLPLAIGRILDTATPAAVYIGFNAAAAVAAVALALLTHELSLEALVGGIVVVGGLSLYHSLPEPHIEVLTADSSDEESSDEDEDEGGEDGDEESPAPPTERTPLRA